MWRGLNSRIEVIHTAPNVQIHVRISLSSEYIVIGISGKYRIKKNENISLSKFPVFESFRHV